MEHGGDIYTEGLLKGKELLDFSSNINPLGVPDSFTSNLQEAVNKLKVYPDSQYRESKGYICTYINQGPGLDFTPADLVLGNGAGENIDLAIAGLESICIVVPSFIEYEKSAKKRGVKVVYSYLDDNMALDYKDLAKKIQGVEGLMIGNPNNPNGGIIGQDKLKPLLDYCQHNNKRVIIDEAFIEFTGCQQDSLLALAQQYSCLCIIRALTKFCGIPGVRLGYSICKDHGYNKEMASKQIPWNINTFAELALKYVLQDQDYIQETLKWLKEERATFIQQLEKVAIIERVYPTNANFVLVKLRGITGKQLYQALLEQGILIRTCSNYEGLDDGYVRFAIKSKENNKMLIRAVSLFHR